MSVTTIVTSTAQLLAALAGAHGGDTIEMAPGTYSNVSINNKNVSQTPPANVLIESEYSWKPAVLTGLYVNNSTGLYFAHLTFSTATTFAGPSGGNYVAPFGVFNSSHMTFAAITVAGSPTQTYATDVTGLLIENSNYVAVRGSSFTYLHAGLTQVGNNYMEISSDSFSNIADDGVRGGGTSNITVTGNTFSSQHLDPADEDHPDAIQFWTSGTTSSASNITITSNVFTRGNGSAVQGIFITDQVGDLPYKNVLIQGNSLTGELYNGIMLDDAISSSVIDNHVTSYPDIQSAVKVFDSTNATVADNAAEKFDFENNINLSQTGNTVITMPNPFPTAGMSAVPEPSAWSMILLGSALCGGAFRSRGRSGLKHA